MKKRFNFSTYPRQTPISSEEIVRQIKKDRWESDKRREAVFDAVMRSSERNLHKRFKTRFSEQLKAKGINE